MAAVVIPGLGRSRAMRLGGVGTQYHVIGPLQRASVLEALHLSMGGSADCTGLFGAVIGSESEAVQASFTQGRSLLTSSFNTADGQPSVTFNVGLGVGPVFRLPVGLRVTAQREFVVLRLENLTAVESIFVVASAQMLRVVDVPLDRLEPGLSG